VAEMIIKLRVSGVTTKIAQIFSFNGNLTGELIATNETLVHRNFLDDNRSNYIDLSYPLENRFSFNIPNQSIFVNALDHVAYTATDTDQILVANSGSYISFPSFYLNGTDISVSKNEVEFISYEALNSQEVVLNTRDHTLSSHGQPVEIIKDSFGVYAYQNINVNNDISGGVESGRPELLKCILYQYNHNTDTNITTLQFLINNNVIYNRFRPFLTHIFYEDFEKEVNVYNKTLYNNFNYYNKYSNFKHLLLQDPLYSVHKEDGGWVLTLMYSSTNKIDNYCNYNFSAQDLNKAYYVSVCDYDSYTIKADDYSVGLQLREVL
jgi:hypothetical protein